MIPTFTHNHREDTPGECPACLQKEAHRILDQTEPQIIVDPEYMNPEAIKDYVREMILDGIKAQEDALKDELLVIYLRQANGPQIVHGILSGTKSGERIFEDIQTAALRIA